MPTSIARYEGDWTAEQIAAGEAGTPVGGKRHDYWRQAERAGYEYVRVRARYDNAVARYQAACENLNGTGAADLQTAAVLVEDTYGELRAAASMVNWLRGLAEKVDPR